jgi:drug/metabolite transporter (DMT)-like permease
MWALEPICAKLAYQSSETLATSAVRAVFVVPVALGYIFLTGQHLRVPRRQWAPIVYIALAATVLADLVYLYAISLSGYPVVNAVLIGHMQPVFVVLICWAILKEDRMNRFDYLGIAIMVVSGLFVATRTTENLRQLQFGTAGDGLVLIATVAWATTTIAMRKYLRDVHAGVLTFYRYAIAAIVLCLWTTLRSGLSAPNRYQILVGLIVGVGTILYYEGLKRIKAAQVSALELSTPFFAAALAFVALRETVTAMQAGGMVLLAVGVWCLAKHEPEPAGTSSSPDS